MNETESAIALAPDWKERLGDRILQLALEYRKDCRSCGAVKAEKAFDLIKLVGLKVSIKFEFEQ